MTAIIQNERPTINQKRKTNQKQTKNQKQKTNQNPQNKNLQSLLVLNNVYIRISHLGLLVCTNCEGPSFSLFFFAPYCKYSCANPEWSSQIIHTIACTMDGAEYRLFVTKEFLSIGVLLYYFPLQS